MREPTIGSTRETPRVFALVWAVGLTAAGTLGPGVKGELACLSCRDGRFGEEGCAMRAVARRRSERLDAGSPVGT